MKFFGGKQRNKPSKDASGLAEVRMVLWRAAYADHCRRIAPLQRQYTHNMRFLPSTRQYMFPRYIPTVISATMCVIPKLMISSGRSFPHRMTLAFWLLHALLLCPQALLLLCQVHPCHDLLHHTAR